MILCCIDANKRVLAGEGVVFGQLILRKII